MAGIGFDLRRLVAEGSGLVSRLRAYASAGLISSGPWLVTICGLLAAGTVGRRFAGPRDARTFVALVTYCFAFSLCAVGGLQMAFTRWVADTLYGGAYRRVLPGFTFAIVVTTVVQSTSCAAFCACAGFSVRLAAGVTWLYVVVSLLWIAQVWLTVIRQFESILLSYIAGVAVFWLLLGALGTQVRVDDAILAYAAGLSLTLVWMVGLVARGTELAESSKLGAVKDVRSYRGLFAIGWVYAAGIWVDKFVFWFADGGATYPLVRFHALYDTCFFLAYLSIVPALSVNLVHFETAFYERYRDYFATILGGQRLSAIEERRGAMVETLRDGAVRMVRIQAAFTIAYIVFAGSLVHGFGLPDFAARVLRLASAGAFFHVLFLVTMLLQLYFDLRRDAWISCVVFFVLNGTLALWSVRAGISTYGAGYALATLLSLLFAFHRLSRSLRNLEFAVFSKQVGG